MHLHMGLSAKGGALGGTPWTPLYYSMLLYNVHTTRMLEKLLYIVTNHLPSKGAILIIDNGAFVVGKVDDTFEGKCESCNVEPLEPFLGTYSKT